MARVIGGVLLGLIAAFVAIWSVEMVNHLIYPLPRDIRVDDPEGLGAYVSAMSIGAQLFVAGGWLAGAFVGGWVAGSISRRTWTIWLIAGLIVIAGLANILYVTHPAFLKIASVIAPLIGGLFAALLLRRCPSAGMGAPV